MLVCEYIEKNGIKIFKQKISLLTEDYDAKGLDRLYQAENRHFWFIARKEFIHQQIKRYLNISAKILEIGAGTGNVTRYLQSKGYEKLSIGEMHTNGLEYAQKYGIKDLYQFNLLQAPFREEFDAVLMFDVLEHIEDDLIALGNVNKMLNNSGYIVLTVPAHQWLWSMTDTLSHHKRRYRKKELIKKIEKCGFEISSARYFFIAILPLLLLRKILQSDHKAKNNIDDNEKGIVINRWINKILLSVTRVENSIHEYIPNIAGGSLLIIARKR